jgi:hypothetical protein
VRAGTVTNFPDFLFAPFCRRFPHFADHLVSPPLICQIISGAVLRYLLSRRSTSRATSGKTSDLLCAPSFRQQSKFQRRIALAETLFRIGLEGLYLADRVLWVTVARILIVAVAFISRTHAGLTQF